ncbi:hypothetical protein EUGRSUZ_K00760 [Eucalyptus grandis]|uniref:Uncharacterized protein n=2 Tax=Eucalyptus grandis TaxID=71139 RepID=A0ACC3IRT8_EUCGR|nr:hypothetical protein EUGRSUZ_K00760 [Eucalyptus grandis]
MTKLWLEDDDAGWLSSSHNGKQYHCRFVVLYLFFSNIPYHCSIFKHFKLYLSHAVNTLASSLSRVIFD